MKQWKITAKIIERWIKKLNELYILEVLEKKDIVKKDYQINRLIEVIEEYDDIIFDEIEVENE